MYTGYFLNFIDEVYNNLRKPYNRPKISQLKSFRKKSIKMYFFPYILAVFLITYQLAKKMGGGRLNIENRQTGIK